jgi:hypothetical protein
MIRFAFYSRSVPNPLGTHEQCREWDFGRSEGFVDQLGGEIVAEYFDIGVPANVKWERRRQAAALLRDMADQNRRFDAVIIPDVRRALYRHACRAMSFFVNASMPVWLPDTGSRFNPDVEEHRLLLFMLNGWESCGGSQCQDAHGDVLCSAKRKGNH